MFSLFAILVYRRFRLGHLQQYPINSQQLVDLNGQFDYWTGEYDGVFRHILRLPDHGIAYPDLF